MCDKCVELDKKIERYRRMSSSLADQITIDRIKTLIDELQTQKVELHRAEAVSLSRRARRRPDGAQRASPVRAMPRAPMAPPTRTNAPREPR
jgi:hypothetical protein